MIRFQIGVGILVLLLLGGLWVEKRMEDIEEPIASAMDDASRLAQAGDRVGAVGRAAAAEAAWWKNHTFMAALADHQPLEDIESMMSQLTAYAEEEDATYAALCAELARRIRAVAEAHRLSAASVF